jgi:hypothetical protein
MQPGCIPSPVVTQDGDHQPLGGDKQAELRPLPPLSFNDVHHQCWGGECAELGSVSAWAAARSFPQ